jgi:hypothetical protein
LFGVTDKGFEELLGIVNNMLPEGSELPSTTYEAKKVVCSLGLEVQKIHACPNDCILYHGDEYEKLDVCPVCGTKRYKIGKMILVMSTGSQPRKKISAKVMWYFPIIHLKRLFRNKIHA